MNERPKGMPEDAPIQTLRIEWARSNQDPNLYKLECIVDDMIFELFLEDHYSNDDYLKDNITYKIKYDIVCPAVNILSEQISLREAQERTIHELCDVIYKLHHDMALRAFKLQMTHTIIQRKLQEDRENNE